MPREGWHTADLPLSFTDVWEDCHGGRDPDQPKQQLPDLPTGCAAALQVSLVLLCEQLQRALSLWECPAWSEGRPAFQELIAFLSHRKISCSSGSVSGEAVGFLGVAAGERGVWGLLF